MNVTLSHHESSNSSASVEATWASVNGRGVTYKVCYRITSELFVEPLSNSHCITGIKETKIVLFPLIRGTTYSVWIAAQNSKGLGVYSYGKLFTIYKCEFMLKYGYTKCETSYKIILKYI